MSLPYTDDAPRLARGAVMRLGGINAIRDDVMLLVSELVSNGVRHADARARDNLLLQVCRQTAAVTISVRDPGRSGTVFRLRQDGTEGAGGLGLMLVDRIAGRWGSDRSDGQVVWAQIDLPPVPGAHIRI